VEKKIAPYLSEFPVKRTNAAAELAERNGTSERPARMAAAWW
jgi:hypothetical protein